MSNNKIKRRVGRPRTNTRRVALTIPQDDYELLEEIASMTSTRPATMIRNILVDNRPMLFSLRDALKASLSGDVDSLTGLASKLIKEVQRQGDDVQQEIEMAIKK